MHSVLFTWWEIQGRFLNRKPSFSYWSLKCRVFDVFTAASLCDNKIGSFHTWLLFLNTLLSHQVPGILSHAWPQHRGSPGVPPPQDGAPQLQLQSREIQTDSDHIQREHGQPRLLQRSSWGAPLRATHWPLPVCRQVQSQQKPSTKWHGTRLGDYRIYPWVSRRCTCQQRHLWLLCLSWLEQL